LRGLREELGIDAATAAGVFKPIWRLRPASKHETIDQALDVWDCEVRIGEKRAEQIDHIHL
jgi:hypothetical protein